MKSILNKFLLGLEILFIIPNITHLFLPTQHTSLLLQPPQQPAHLPHHLAITRPVLFALAHNHREVEYKLIARVFALADAHGVADDAVVVGAKR